MADPIGVVTFMLRDLEAMEGFFTILEYYNRKGVWPPVPSDAPTVEIYKTTGAVYFRSQPVVQASTALVVLPKDTRLRFIAKNADSSFYNFILLQNVGNVAANTPGWVSSKYVIKET